MDLALGAAVAVILPTAPQTELLRACLLRGPAGRGGWRAWQEHVGDVKQAVADDTHGVKSLLPLLYRARSEDDGSEDELLPYLRTAYFREELRAGTYERICGEALDALDRAGLPAIVVMDAALAATAYADGATRHCHRIDLLLDDPGRAAEVLGDLGYARVVSAFPDTVQLRHPSGLPLGLQRSLFREPFGRGTLDVLRDRTATAVLGGVAARVLSPEDSLVHICGHVASSRGRLSLQWACDAWHVVAARPAPDWDRVVRDVETSRFVLPAYVMLEYLSRELAAPIPARALERIRAASARADALTTDIGLHRARAIPGAGFWVLLRRTPSLRGRAQVVRAMLLPSPRYFAYMAGRGRARLSRRLK